MGRRKSDGQIVETADGWEARLWIPATEDKKARRATRRGRTKALAEAALRDLRREVAEPKAAAALRVRNRMTVEAFIGPWEALLAVEVVDGQIREEHAAKTLQRVRTHVLGELGGMRLCEVRASHVAGVSARLAAAGYAEARGARRAQDAGGRGEGRAGRRLGAEVPGSAQDGPARRQASAFADTVRRAAGAAGSRSASGALLVLLAAETGARRGEVCGARWEDLDLVGRSWTVRTSLSRAVLVEHPLHPKNGLERVVPLPGFVAEALREARRGAPFRTWVGELDELPGEPINPNAISYVQRRIAAEVGAPGGLHSLRRYVATRLLNTTGDLDLTAEIIGHKSIEVLRKRYVTTRDDRAATAMDAVFG